MGAIFATAANSRALYPTLKLTLAANKGKTLRRAPTGLTETSSEAQVDAFLKNPGHGEVPYPHGRLSPSRGPSG